MSLYEVLVFVALAGVGAYAYSLYRSDTRGKSAKPEGDHAEVGKGRSMFGRAPRQRAGDDR
jgi:hypothetical protein